MSRTIPEMVTELETLLHEELPAAAKGFIRDHADPALVKALDTIDELQRAIGMATFEAMRRGEAQGNYLGKPTYAADTPPSLVPTESEEYSLPGTSATPPEGFEPPVAPRPKCRGCSAFAASNCPNCNLPFCTKHSNPVSHPCGELIS